MDTPVTLEAVAASAAEAARADDALAQGFNWVRAVEAACSRFDPASEVRRLAARPGEDVAVGPLLFQALRLALEVARLSDGAFDPTIGQRMEARGFDRNYRTGRPDPAAIPPDGRPTWRDVVLDAGRQTVTLRRPLLLDLGGVAKGLAVDLALRALAGFPGCAAEAGGDVAVRGVSASGGPWRIGIRHPRRPEAVCAVLEVSEGAVCTSGDYERRARDGGSHHLDPRSGRPVEGTASCTVVAPQAVLADALSTAATVLLPRRGVAWLRRQGVDGILFTAALRTLITPGLAGLPICL